MPGPRVLDLGVGPGTSAVEMAHADPTRRHLGLDRSAPMLRRAARAAASARVALPLVRADALALPFASGALDAITGHSVLYLLPDPAAALAEAHRALRPGGGVAFLEPRAGRASLLAAARRGVRQGASMALWRVMASLHRRFGEEELAALLHAAGFEGVHAAAVLDGFGLLVTATRP